MRHLSRALMGAALLITATPVAGPAQSRALLAGEQLTGMRWRNIGPANMGGRISDFAVAQVPGAPDVIYLGTAAGGVFRSSNQGTTWEPLFDDIDGLLTIGDIAVAPSNPSVVWVGTGESNNRQSISWGDGVYRSTDAGETWQHLGLKETRHIGRIAVHPANPDVAYVAAGGHLWGPNPERGVFRTTDGGKTWQKVLYIDENTGATDLVMDPQDPQTLIAAMYQRQRTAWGFAGGGPGSGIFKSTDGGDTWRRIEKGVPAGDKGRIGLDVHARDGRIMYASIEAEPEGGKRTSGVYRSADRGESWEQMSTINVRPMYFSQIRADPNDPQRVFMNGTEIQLSIDGGRTFSESSYGGGGVHPDIHAMWIDPRDSNHVLVGNDGGVMISWDAGEHWKFIDNLALGQFYEIDADMRDPYYVCGGLQDNGTWCIPSATRSADGITNHEVYNVGGGDGFYARIDPTDPNIVFVESQNGRLQRFHLDSRERQAVSPLPLERPDREDDMADRWNWNSPVEMSSFDPSTIYYGGSQVWRSTDRGVSWSAISPDLTWAIDRDTLEIMGERVTEQTLSRHDGQSTFGTLTTISESPLSREVLYAGSDDGRVQVTRDGGATWTDLSARFPGVPARTYVSRLVASRHAPGRVYATFDGHHGDDYKPYVFASEDYGQSWRAITRGLPEETSVTVIREHPRNPRLLFVGHEKGLHASVDGGQSWIEPGSGLPNVPVEDILVHPRDNDLIAGTHARSIWILDDLAPLEALASGSFAAGSAAVLPSRDAELINPHSPQGWVGSGQFAGANPEFGAAIAYWLPEASADSVGVTIRDASGATVRSLRGPGGKGLNRMYWDFRMEPPYAPLPGEEPGSGPQGPKVLPGTYTVAIGAPGAAETTGTIRVVGDPLIRISEADRRARQDALMAAHEALKSFGKARAAVKGLSAQLGAAQEQLGADVDEAYVSATAMQAARQRVAALVTRVDALERDVDREIGDLGRGVTGAIGSFTGAPRPDQLRQIEWAYEAAARLVSDLNALSQTEVPGLFADLRGQGIWPLPAPRVEAPVRR